MLKTKIMFLISIFPPTLNKNENEKQCQLYYTARKWPSYAYKNPCKIVVLQKTKLLLLGQCLLLFSILTKKNYTTYDTNRIIYREINSQRIITLYLLKTVSNPFNFTIKKIYHLDFLLIMKKYLMTKFVLHWTRKTKKK